MCVQWIEMKRDLNVEVYRHFMRQKLPNLLHNPPMHPISPEQPQNESTKKSSKHRNKIHAYYDQFKPMLFVLTLFGRLAVQNVKGQYQWKKMSWLMLFCIINYSLQTYLAYLVCIKRFNALIDAKGNYDEFIFSIHILAYLNIHFHLPFTYWLQGPKLAEYLNLWTEFQEKWYETFGVELSLSLKKVVCRFTCFTIPSVILLLSFEKYSTLLDPWHYLLPYFFTIVSTMLILGLWYCTCVEIGRLAKIMNYLLIKNLEGRPNIVFIQQWRHLWIMLCTLTSSLGSHLAAIVISIILTFSATFLLGLYNALSHLIRLDVSWKTVGYLSASNMSLCIIYIFCDAGHHISSKVSTYVIHNILNAKQPATSQEIKYEVNLLLKSIETDPLQIELAGFVTMDRPLFISFVSNTLTYLIVILQFKFN